MSVRSRIDCPSYHQVISKKGTKSSIWQYFGFPADESGKIIGENNSICKLCQNAVSSKATSNLWSHLKCHHPLQYSNLNSRVCRKYEDLKKDDCQASLLMMQKKKLGAHEIEMLFQLVLTWSHEILANMSMKDGNTDSLEAARKWFETKATAVKGIWWPQQYGVQYEVYSNAVRMSSYYLDIIDERSREDIIEWLKLSKEITLKHIKFCLRRQKKKRVLFTSCFSGFSFEKFASRLDKLFFRASYENYEFFSEKPHVY